jgi:hypothetical protein
MKTNIEYKKLYIAYRAISARQSKTIIDLKTKLRYAKNTIKMMLNKNKKNEEWHLSRKRKYFCGWIKKYREKIKRGENNDKHFRE